MKNVQIVRLPKQAAILPKPVCNHLAELEAGVIYRDKAFRLQLNDIK